MEGLKIYACSGFGGVGNSAADYNYWLDNTATVRNTRAVNDLLAEINLLFSDLQYKELSDNEIRKDLNLVDLYVVCLKGAERYTGDKMLMTRWGSVINSMNDEGLFNFVSLDNNERDVHLDGLLEEAERRMADNSEYVLSGSFGRWYTREVLNEDWNGIIEGDKDVFSGIRGIGATGADAGKLLNDGGYYFFGTYLTDKQIKIGGKAIDTRVRYERDLYKKTQETYSSLYSEKGFARVVYSGCQNSLKQSPEVFADKVFNTKTRGVGITEAVLIAILQLLQAVLPAVISAIGIIVSAVVMYNSNKLTISKKDIENGCIDDKEIENVYNNARKNNTIKADSGSLLMIGLLVGLVYKKLKKK